MIVYCETQGDIVIITFKNKKYKINRDKLNYVVTLLENHVNGEISCMNNLEIIQKLSEYDLLNEDFLDNINNLW